MVKAAEMTQKYTCRLTFNEQKQCLCTCILYYGTFLCCSLMMLNDQIIGFVGECKDNS